ncbi:putative Mg2+ transporter-C (MgtC) family protein [Stackebrandtia albiflava]|uniref:Putative Mg2+ transporter-C (MgtC) family protein n=1 Tax=Stackebrandtia albiflava TaxID=406432 RepID=A0A562UQR9_9ACTN|nr:MgtC/SapB family protein [Stackebrandtia albiflava]TWJ07948.1 putative Mg2+ transporter-C (MgtC) family protein [Stackebrandtia albiflava]
MDFWEHLGLLGLALFLGLLIGAEREYEGKPAGMRTHALIALGSALFVMAGRYGFDVSADSPGVDPARIAAQVVSGIGFLGAGVIFFQRNLVFGMTTAASIWVTTAIAMACAAGLPVIAVGVTVLHLIVVAGLTPMERLIGRFAKRSGRLQLTYDSGTALAAALALCTSQGFTVTEVSTERSREGSRSTRLTVRGRGSIAKLTSDLSQEAHMLGVTLEEL